MESFAYWLNKPSKPWTAPEMADRINRIPEQAGNKTRFVIIRYRGSIARSAIKTLIVFALLAIMSNVIGERTSQNLDAKEVALTVGSAWIQR